MIQHGRVVVAIVVEYQRYQRTDHEIYLRDILNASRCDYPVLLSYLAAYWEAHEHPDSVGAVRVLLPRIRLHPLLIGAAHRNLEGRYRVHW